MRKANGALVTVSHISPYPALLHEQTRSKRWEDAVRLCRYAKMKELWACLAVMAVNGQDLNTAEVAYAMIQEPAKVQYICRIRDIPSLDRRNAEMALFRRQPKEAESILLSSSLIYRAIMMWVYLYQWDRALEIAVKYKTHVDTVLYFRRKYLRTFERKETNKRYIQVSEGVEVDEDIIIEKMNVEEERELHKIIR